MGVLGVFFKLTGVTLAGGVGVTAYSYPELRKEPLQIFYAMNRGLRVVKAGSLMALDYMNVRKILTNSIENLKCSLLTYLFEI